MERPTVIAAPATGVVAEASLERFMSPAQARSLEDLRAEHPGREYTATYVHAISGMLEVRVRASAFEADMWTIGLSPSGHELPARLVGR